MFNMIQEIYKSPLKNKLWFKWWTLCYFLHNLSRFSTDLDFDIIIDDGNIMQEMKNVILNFWKEIKAQIPKDYNPTNILAEIWELIDEKQKYFVKNQLIDEVLWYIDFMISENSK